MKAAEYEEGKGAAQRFEGLLKKALRPRKREGQAAQEPARGYGKKRGKRKKW